MPGSSRPNLSLILWVFMEVMGWDPGPHEWDVGLSLSESRCLGLETSGRSPSLSEPWSSCLLDRGGMAGKTEAWSCGWTPRPGLSRFRCHPWLAPESRTIRISPDHVSFSEITSAPSIRVPAARGHFPRGPGEVGGGAPMGSARPRPAVAALWFLIKFYRDKAVPVHLPTAPGWFSSHVASGLVV